MSINKDAAVKMAIKSSKEYEANLAHYKYLLLCRNNKNNDVDCFEIRFPRYAYKHLTGITTTKNSKISSANSFYDACINGKLSSKDIEEVNKGFTEKKLAILPQLIKFIHYSRMSVVYDGGRPVLKCDKVVGTTNFSLALSAHDDYYVPTSCLNEDVRNFGDDIYQVLAVFSAELTAAEYKKIRNVAKGVNLKNITIPVEYANIINLCDYREPQ